MSAKLTERGLECARLQVESCPLVQTEHDVHVLHSLTYGALEEVVYH